MWVELHPRQSEQLGSQSAAGGDHVGNHQVRVKFAQSGDVELRHAPGTLVDLGPGIGVVVAVVRIEAGEFDGIDTGSPGGFEPFHPGQQRRGIPAARNFRHNARAGKHVRDRARRPPLRAPAYLATAIPH